MDGPTWDCAKRWTLFGLVAGLPLTATLFDAVDVGRLGSRDFWIVCGAFPVLFGVVGAVIGYLHGGNGPRP